MHYGNDVLTRQLMKELENAGFNFVPTDQEKLRTSRDNIGYKPYKIVNDEYILSKNICYDRNIDDPTTLRVIYVHETFEDPRKPHEQVCKETEDFFYKRGDYTAARKAVDMHNKTLRLEKRKPKESLPRKYLTLPDVEEKKGYRVIEEIAKEGRNILDATGLGYATDFLRGKKTLPVFDRAGQARTGWEKKKRKRLELLLGDDPNKEAILNATYPTSEAA